MRRDVSPRPSRRCRSRDGCQSRLGPRLRPPRSHVRAAILSRPLAKSLCLVRREPLQRGGMMLVLGYKQRHQYVDVEKTDQGLRYSPEPSARRSTSSTKSEGAPGRRGKTGTPRSKDTSASANRRSRASTNSSTCWPFWPARSASRSFNAASTVIVAFAYVYHCPTTSPQGRTLKRCAVSSGCARPAPLATQPVTKRGRTKSAWPQIARKSRLSAGSLACPGRKGSPVRIGRPDHRIKLF